MGKKVIRDPTWRSSKRDRSKETHHLQKCQMEIYIRILLSTESAPRWACLLKQAPWCLIWFFVNIELDTCSHRHVYHKRVDVLNFECWAGGWLTLACLYSLVFSVNVKQGSLSTSAYPASLVKVSVAGNMARKSQASCTCTVIGVLHALEKLNFRPSGSRAFVPDGTKKKQSLGYLLQRRICNTKKQSS